MENLKLKKEPRMSRTLYVVDIDDTLFESKCQIYIKKNGKTIKTLSPAEYNFYKKTDGEIVDFSDFSNTKLFIETAKPILPTLDKLVSIINDIIIKKKRDKIILLTSRPDFDNKSKILKFFETFGIPVHHSKIVEIVRCGNISDRLWTTAQKKQIIVAGFLLQNKYKDFIMWDDNIDNLERFYEIKLSSFKPVNFNIGHITHSVDQNGNSFNFKLNEIKDKDVEKYIKQAREQAQKPTKKIDLSETLIKNNKKKKSVK